MTSWEPFEFAPQNRQIEVMGEGKYPHRFRFDRVNGEWQQLVSGDAQTWHIPFFEPICWRDIS